MNFKKAILRIVTEIQHEFKTNELAYLVVTSKIEHALRDRIAFVLHRLFQDNFLICREWCKDRKRTDLAIVGKKDNKPKLLIEFKARSVPGYSTRDTANLLVDLKKMAIVADNNTPLYCIFFNTCIQLQKIIDPKYIEAVKNLHRINKRINDKKTINAMIDEFWMKHLKGLPKNKFKKIEIQAGVYYKTPVSIITYVYGPIFKAELLVKNGVN